MASYIIYNMEMRKVTLDMIQDNLVNGEKYGARTFGPKGVKRMSRKWVTAVVCFVLLLALWAQGALAATLCQQGDTGEQVRAVQTRLYSLGYLDSAPVSPYKFNASTKTAVKKFQLASGLTQSGTVDENTYQLLILSTAVTYDQYQDSIHVLGGSGEEVKTTKNRLKKLGYFTGTANNNYDAATQTAVAFFQRAHALAETGEANAATRELLFSDQALTVQEYKQVANLSQLKKGDKNSQVGVVQGQLAAMGYYQGSINNSYDAATVSAMKLFQEANGIKATGVADEVTRSLLNAGTGRTYDEYVAELSVMEVSKGDTGLSVTLLQERLAELAYYDGAINGKYNADVVTAVKRFQIANSVNASGTKHGVATAATRTAMNSADAINRYDAEGLLPGDQSSDVKDLTSALHLLGYLSGTTNKYSSAVTAAVKVFQTANELAVSGNATPETLKLLYSGDAISYDAYKNGSGNERIEKVINWAYKQLGKPYKSPCNMPSSFDCSNFTKFCFSKGANISLPGEVASQGNACKKKYTIINDMNSLKRGDLLFFDTQENKPIGHAAIYLGKVNGSPRFIHASSAAGKVVVTVFKDWYQQRFLFGARLIK